MSTSMVVDSNGLLSGMIDCLNLKTKQIDGLSSISVLLFNSTKPEIHTQLEDIFSSMDNNNTTESVQKVASYVVAMLWRSSNTIIKEKRNVLQHDDDSIVRLKDETRTELESYIFSYYEADSSKRLSSYLEDKNKHNP